MPAACRLAPIELYLNTKFLDNGAKYHIEKLREVRQDFEFLQNTQDNPYASHVWGFRIHRAVYSPGLDERFAADLVRLETWVR